MIVFKLDKWKKDLQLNFPEDGFYPETYSGKNKYPQLNCLYFQEYPRLLSCRDLCIFLDNSEEVDIY